MDPATESGPPPPEGGSRLRVTAGRAAAVSIMLGIALMWIFALAQDPRRPPGMLEDPAFAVEAERICLAAGEQAVRLPPAFEAVDAADRADTIDEANTFYAVMLDELTAVAPTTGEDGRMVSAWLADWRTYLGDRARYAERLRADPEARFLVTDKDGDQITEPIDRFANVNRMLACSTPGDLG